MSYKKIRSIPLSEKRQGFIRFCCLTYDDQPKRTQERIRRICREQGDQYEDALFRIMTTTDSIRKIAIDMAISESTLYRLRYKFYTNWF